AASPPTIRLQPSARPHTPPDTPASSQPSCAPAAASARRMESFQLELAPSTTTSPGDSERMASSSTCSVAAPAGTIDHTTRGARSCSTAAVTLAAGTAPRSEEHTSELQSRENLVCRLLLETKE